MRISSAVTSVSWIPSEAIEGIIRTVWDLGVTEYDDAPPGRFASLADLEALVLRRKLRFANRLDGWIDVEDGRIVDFGRTGRTLVAATSFTVGRRLGVEPLPLGDIDHEPEVGDGWVRFRRTAGAATGVPNPRHVNHPPFFQLRAPIAWTTVALTIHADGRAEYALEGASTFPRHWLYDAAGAVTHKSAVIDFKEWYRHAFGRHTPWGDEDSPALVAEVESALERRMSREVMRGDRDDGPLPTSRRRRLAPGETLTEQGEPSTEVYLVLDGVLAVHVEGVPIAEIGPGAVVGERAGLEEGVRTATLVAVTPCRVAVAPGTLPAGDLAAVAAGHRRET
ncbi:MAG TPA: cyclic nucleotide-binding domain-containing protein [Acidimicrobiales bacterium]|nr:cyclic nucleotide-binding domain-containing protein [Acidimicrobiales bacterium]